MGRYDKEPAEGVVPEPVSNSPRNSNIMPMEVKFEFNPQDCSWYVKIKKEDKEAEDKWEFVQRKISGERGGFSMVYVTFETADQAQEWCEKVGLL